MASAVQLLSVNIVSCVCVGLSIPLLCFISSKATKVRAATAWLAFGLFAAITGMSLHSLFLLVKSAPSSQSPFDASAPTSWNYLARGVLLHVLISVSNVHLCGFPLCFGTIRYLYLRFDLQRVFNLSSSDGERTPQSPHSRSSCYCLSDSVPIGHWNWLVFSDRRESPSKRVFVAGTAKAYHTSIPTRTWSLSWLLGVSYCEFRRYNI